MGVKKKGFMKHLGGLHLKKLTTIIINFLEKFKICILNTGGIHGGYLATIADAGMGTHMISSNKRCVTINLDLKFFELEN